MARTNSRTSLGAFQSRFLPKAGSGLRLRGRPNLMEPGRWVPAGVGVFPTLCQFARGVLIVETEKHPWNLIRFVPAEGTRTADLAGRPHVLGGPPNDSVKLAGT
jgi:hypothetical protein